MPKGIVRLDHLPRKDEKKSLKAEPRRTFITFLLPNSPTGPTFFVLDVLKRHFFPKKNTRLNYNPAFLLDCERELFQKRKKKGDDNRLKWFLSNYDVSGHHQGDQLVVNLNTLKPTRHLEFWNPRPWNTSKRFKSSGVFRAICKCSKYWTGGENFFGILSRYLTNQWDLDLKPKKRPLNSKMQTSFWMPQQGLLHGEEIPAKNQLIFEKYSHAL